MYGWYIVHDMRSVRLHPINFNGETETAPAIVRDTSSSNPAYMINQPAFSIQYPANLVHHPLHPQYDLVHHPLHQQARVYIFKNSPFPSQNLGSCKLVLML